MLAMISDCSIRNIKGKLAALYILNITDLVFTLILLGTGLFQEINFIMRLALDDPLLCFLLKIVLPAALIIYINIRIRKASTANLKKANILLNVIISFYFLINLNHIIWLVITAFAA